jgi:nicotinamidase-related amidase
MKVLVVVDAQNDFITGLLGSEEAQSAVPAIAAKIDEYMKNTDLVVFTQDTHYDNYMETDEGKYLPVIHCLERTWGWEIDERLDMTAPHIQKYTFGCYELPETLIRIAESCDAEIDQIELCGFCTDICVISNALILKSVFAPMGIDIVVDSHACAGVTPEKHNAALEVMKSCQIIVKE